MSTSMPNDGWANVDRIIEKVKSIAGELAIIVVANIKNEIQSGLDLSRHSLETEYFSPDELEEIIASMRQLGIFVEPFFSEDEFIQAHLSGKTEGIPKKHKIVYNSAQTGVGPGRKALVPAFCQLHGVPTTSSDPYVVSLARQKYHVNRILKAVGIPVPESWTFDWRKGWNLGQSPPKGTKVIIKPSYESASIGIDENSVALADSSLAHLVGSISERFKQPVTVQAFISGYEVEAPLIGFAAPFVPALVGLSLDEQKLLGENILSYETVYRDGYGFYLFDVQNVDHGLIIKTAGEVLATLGIQGLGRVDFRIDEMGNHYVMDVATNPHVIPHSSFAFAFKKSGRTYNDLIALLVGLGCQRAGWIA